MTGPRPDATPEATLRPARRAVVSHHAAASSGLAGLIAAFLLALVTLPTLAAAAISAALAVAAIWLVRRASAVAQLALMVAADGVAVRHGARSAQVGWGSVEQIAVVGSGSLVAVEVHADRLTRTTPAVLDADDARRWLRAAPGLAARAGREDLRLDGDALTSG